MSDETDAIDIGRLGRLFPHAWPFALFDRIESYNAGGDITGVKVVSANEPFLHGLPGRGPGTVMPGVLVLEALVQLGALLVDASEKLGDDALVHVVGCEHVRFRGLVQVGDKLELDVGVVQRETNTWSLKGAATKRGITAVAADIVLATVSRR